MQLKQWLIWAITRQCMPDGPCSSSLQNSNLVLTANRSTRVSSEPSGAPETLRGKKMFAMGDRARAEKPQAASAPKRRGDEDVDPLLRKQKRARADVRSVMDIDAAGLYRPRTKETRAAYEALLSQVQSFLGDQPQDILRGAADEVLGAIKTEGRTNPDKKKELENLLGPIDEERFGTLHMISDLINDYTPEAEREARENNGDGDFEEMGVAVEFEDEDEGAEDAGGIMAEVRGQCGDSVFPSAFPFSIHPPFLSILSPLQPPPPWVLRKTQTLSHPTPYEHRRRWRATTMRRGAWTTSSASRTFVRGPT